MSFTLFGRLLPELRLYIWHLSLPEDEPEVCIMRLRNLGPEPGDAMPFPDMPLLVDTGFPVAMHVCGESRHAVMTSKMMRFRSSQDAGCAVPCRRFNPALDTLYWSSEEFVACNLHLRRHIEVERLKYLKDVRNLAVDARWGPYVSGLMLRGLAADLRKRNVCNLSLVVPDTQQRLDLWRRFRPPSRRCKLVRMSADETRSLGVDLESARLSSDGVMSLQQGIHTIAGNLARDSQRCRSGVQTLMGGDGFVFAVYQKDGSWRKGCAERMCLD